MIECTTTEDAGLKWVNIKGRIDSMTSPEARRHFDEAVQSGERVIVANLEEVNYISSAGLRIFLTVQKQLKKVGGELILYRLSGYGLDVFNQGGILDFFRLVASGEEIASTARDSGPAADIVSMELDSISMRYVEKPAAPGLVSPIGSQEKLAFADYTEDDVVGVKTGEFRFATGLAALGEQYDDYRHLFGEALLMDGNFFFYPAVKRPAVDFMLASELESGLQYQFLHGFGFTGDFRFVASFESGETFIPLARLVDALFQISGANILGIVLLAESKGLWGMNLKKVPLRENRPRNGKAIFDAENFADWMNFPVEPSDFNHVVAAAGVAVRDRSTAGAAVQGFIPEGSRFHLHGAVFEKEPLGKKVEHFKDELKRVLTELDVYKVQHLLGQTLFGSGMVGVIEIEG
jgi:anti-anti-sigma factor